jgi:hypothetical protein
MLAPLKDRNLIERDTDCRTAAELHADNAALKLRLRQARQMQKRTATLSTRKLIELTNEKQRLAELNLHLQKRLAELESGETIVALGQQLMSIRQENDELLEAAKCVWFLDRTLCAARRECERLARERDNALDCLQSRSGQRLDD